MAKQMTVKEILSDLTIDKFYGMSEKEQRKIVTTLNSAANKRIKRINEKGIRPSRALAYQSKYYWGVNRRDFVKGGTVFSVKGKKGDDLTKAYLDVKHFLNLQTSSLSGIKEREKNIVISIGNEEFEKRYRRLSDDKQTKFWESFHSMEEKLGIIYADEKEKYKILMEIVRDNLSNGSGDLLKRMKQAEKYVDKLYEDYQRRMDEYGIKTGFELGDDELSDIVKKVEF